MFRWQFIQIISEYKPAHKTSGEARLVQYIKLNTVILFVP